MGSLSSPGMDHTLSLLHSSERSRCHQLVLVSPWTERRWEREWRCRCDCTDWESHCRDKKEVHCILAWTLGDHPASIVLRLREHCRDLRADQLCVVVRWDLCSDRWGESESESRCLLQGVFDIFRLNRIDEGLVGLWIGLASEPVILVVCISVGFLVYDEIADGNTDSDR